MDASSSLTVLPDDPFFHLFTFLNAPGLSSISVTCKRLYALAQQPWLKLASPYFSNPADLQQMSWRALQTRMAKVKQFPKQVTRTTLSNVDLTFQPLKLGEVIAFRGCNTVRLWQPDQKKKEEPCILLDDYIIGWSPLPQEDGSFYLALLTSKQSYRPSERQEGDKLQVWSTSPKLMHKKFFECKASQLTCLHSLESPTYWLATILNGNELSIFDPSEKHAYQFGKLTGSAQYDYLEGKDGYLIADSYGDSVGQRTVFQCSQSVPPQQLWQTDLKKIDIAAARTRGWTWENCICQLDEKLITIALTPDSQAKVFDLKTGEVVRSIALEKQEATVTIIPGKWAKLKGSNPISLRLWSLETGDISNFQAQDIVAIPDFPSCFARSLFNSSRTDDCLFTTTLECTRLNDNYYTIFDTKHEQSPLAVRPIASLAPGIVAISLEAAPIFPDIEIFDFLSDSKTI